MSAARRGPMFEDTASMLDAAFANYTLKTIVPLNKVCGSIEQKGKKTYYVCPERIQYPVKDGEELTTQIQLDKDIQQINVYLDKKLICVKKLAVI